jgi:hypothetical protein
MQWQIRQKQKFMMKSTKVYELSSGCLIQVSTVYNDIYGNVESCAEALEFVPNARLDMF